VFIPQCRRQKLYPPLRQPLGEVFRQLAPQKECQLLEGHWVVDQVPRRISIPPKYAVAPGVGYRKGKSAIHVARTFGGRQKNFTGEHFGARGYFVSTVGRDEKVIREYLQRQEQEDRRLDQRKMFD
jgi:putative transposase